MDVARLFDLVPDALLVVAADGRIRHANAATATVFGWEPAELAGQPVEVLLPTAAQAEHAAQRARFLAQPEARQMRAGRPLWGAHKDGRAIPLLVSLAPAHALGEGFVLAVVRPISMPTVLELQERLTRAAVAAAANGIVITDVQGVIVHVNDAFTRLTGYAAAEVLGQSPRILKSGHHDPAFYRALWETVLRGEVWSGEVVNRRKDGSTYVEEQTITPVPDEHGVVTHFVAIKQDVTHRRANESALRHRLDELSLLHELALLSASRVASTTLATRAAEIVAQRMGLASFRVEPAFPGAGVAPEVVHASHGREVVSPLRVGDETLGSVSATFVEGAEIGDHEVFLVDTVARQLALALKNATLLEELERRAHTDALTGLENRHRFIERARAEIERARRYGRALSLVMIDVDHFKRINDTRGHAHGDEVLKRLADVLRTTARLSDVVARFGGEEFVSLLPETSPDGARTYVERVRAELEAGHARGRPFCTFSAGIANWGADYDDLEAMLRAADSALYGAKSSGRNTSEMRLSRPGLPPDYTAMRRVSSKPPGR